MRARLSLSLTGLRWYRPELARALLKARPSKRVAAAAAVAVLVLVSTSPLLARFSSSSAVPAPAKGSAIAGDIVPRETLAAALCPRDELQHRLWSASGSVVSCQISSRQRAVWW